MVETLITLDKIVDERKIRENTGCCYSLKGIVRFTEGYEIFITNCYDI